MFYTVVPWPAAGQLGTAENSAENTWEWVGLQQENCCDKIPRGELEVCGFQERGQVTGEISQVYA